jgi:CubicO group peptidase (beta-lactamase class C family)
MVSRSRCPAGLPLACVMAALLLPAPACSPPEADSQPADETGLTGDTPGDPAEECGAIDSATLRQAVDWIASNRNYIDSFQVHHCGEPLVEQYYNGYSDTTPHELQSATKTYTAVLIGIAIDQGVIRDVDQPILELLPAYADLLTGEKAEITVSHLLTMTSGLAWTDFGAGNSFDRIEAADDSVAFILGEPLVTSPGEAFYYNTGSSHLLSAILHHNAGMTTAEYADRHLFGPLGVEEVEWPALRDGVNRGGWGMYLLPRDFAKLGQLLLDEGMWQGERVVSQEFVDAATAPHVETEYGGSYGYQMWIQTEWFDADDIAAARGYGGQDCFVLEDLDLVATFTGDIDKPEAMAVDVTNLMNEYVLTAHAAP